MYCPKKAKLGLVITALLSTISAEALAYVRGEVFASAGFSNLNSENNGSNVTWVSTIGYQHNLSPFIAIEGGYTSQISGTSTFSDNKGNEIFVDYWGAFIGGQVQHHLRNLTLYGKLGASYIDMEENHFDGDINTKDPKENHQSIQPYAAIGASFTSPLRRDVLLGVEFHYQSLDAGYNATSLTVSAKYQF